MNLPSLGVTKLSIFVLAVMTGVIHLFLGDVIFVLNGIGYLSLVAIYLFAASAMKPDMFEPIRPTLSWLLIGYTGLTFFLFFIIEWPDVFFPLGLFTKFVEFILIIQLIRDRESSVKTL